MYLSYNHRPILFLVSSAAYQPQALGLRIGDSLGLNSNI
jgi:hypothetical protein